MADPDPQLIIERLGAGGDGIADSDGVRHFVPFALPGETFRRTASAWHRETTSPERNAPPCRHFGTCGGCVAQHMSESLYAEWKRAIVVEAFRHRGLAPDVAPLQAILPRSRRRAALTAVRVSRGIVLGFREEAGQTVVDVEMCEVLRPSLLGALPAVRALLALVLDVGAEARVTLTESATGLDVILEGASKAPGAAQRAEMAAIATRHRLARVIVDDEEVVMFSRPALAIAGTLVPLPAGVFIQAVAEAEAALVEAVTAAAGKSKRIVDLFCGLGTFALPLARRARVTALDSDPAAIAALEYGARHAQGLKPIEARRRDLFREPFSRTELKDFDLAVLDPPRAGARAQAETLAKSAVPRIVYVSCNPATLARDCRILVDGGFRLEAVTPIDQFVYAAHVECVAILEREASRTAQRASRRST